jgi:hypothetical protein
MIYLTKEHLWKHFLILFRKKTFFQDFQIDKIFSFLLSVQYTLKSGEN